MTVRHAFLPYALAAALAMAVLSPSASADALQDATKSLRQGQHAQALDQVDKFLSASPNDASGRFLKGVILTEMNRTQDAIAVFTKMTEDYPELPEPYNNLAVIYAQQKQYDKARQSLEMAIRTHPSYATAHENLGDIYARMASQAYDKALQLDSSNATAQTKLAMIRDLMSVAPRGTRVAAAPITPPVVASPAPVEPAKPVQVAVAPEVKHVVAPTPPEPEKPAPAAADTDDIAKAVDGWAAAWSAKDVKGYLAHYAGSFKTPGGVSRSKWEAERSSRIGKPGAIQVTVENLSVSTNGPDQATVKFRQHYSSASLKSSSNKVLMMIRQGGKWLIQQERIGS
jgi:tetratricopeptide (TPR) repeat protein